MARKRISHTITLPKDLDNWVNRKIEDLTFKDRTHAIEKALIKLKNDME